MSRLKFSTTLNMNLTRTNKLYKKQKSQSILNLRNDRLNTAPKKGFAKVAKR